jgi:hypothetical protein
VPLWIAFRIDEISIYPRGDFFQGPKRSLGLFQKYIENQPLFVSFFCFLKKMKCSLILPFAFVGTECGWSSRSSSTAYLNKGSSAQHFHAQLYCSTFAEIHSSVSRNMPLTVGIKARFSKVELTSN